MRSVPPPAREISSDQGILLRSGRDRSADAADHSIRGDRVAFVAENDVWLTDAAGGRAWRLTADSVPVAGARLSPDGETVAFTSSRDGAPELHAVPAAGGPSSRTHNER